MLVYLSFLVCAIGTHSCHVSIPETRPFAGLAACQLQGVMDQPGWESVHPGLKVSKIRCTLGSKPLAGDGA